MQRILAEIIEVKELSSRKVEGIGFSEYFLKVKMKEAACKGYVLPPRTKRRVHSIIRRYPFLRKPEIGDEIILTPDDVQRFFYPLRIDPPILDPVPDEVRFRLLLHNPAGKELDYRITFPHLKKETLGSLTQSKEITVAIPRTMAYGCHLIHAVCGSYSAKAILPIVKPGNVYSYAIDANRDGMEERIIENEFLRLSLVPHLGARVESIWLKNSQQDTLARTFEYDKDDYVEYGGCDEHVGDFPGDLWKAKFKEVKHSDSSITLSHSWKGLHAERKVELLPSLPLIYNTVKIKWRGKGEKDILYWHRMAMALDNPTSASVVYVQTREKLEKVRYIRPSGWWIEQKEHYGPKSGAVVYSNENRREMFSFLTDQDSLEFVGCTSTKGFCLLTPYFSRKKLKSEEEIVFHYIYTLGEDFHLDSEACFVASATPWRNGSRYLAVMGKTEQEVDELQGELSTGESITLRPQNFDGVGKVFVAVREIYSKEKTEVKFKIAKKTYSLRLKEVK